MPLSELQIKKAKPLEKPYKLSDGRGMFLLINPNGSKLWRCKYRFNGKEKTYSIGPYPEISLKIAREKREEARRLLSEGVDPSFQKQLEKSASQLAASNTFEMVGREWLEKESHIWSKSHFVRVERYLEKDLFPFIGKRAVSEISAPELLEVLRKVEARKAIETAHRVKQTAGMVFRYAIVTGRAERDPSADLKGALKKPIKTNYSAITDVDKVGPLLRMLDGYDGTIVVKTALKLSPLLFLRPGELRRLEWSEINFERSRIEIPGSKMKGKRDHIVPLSKQAKDLLKDLNEHTGMRQYVFPGERSPRLPMSEEAVRAALRRMGISKDEMTGHGFRAMARTLLDEELEFKVEWIEQQLAHAVKDLTGTAYNRTKHLKQRTEMMQVWADYLDSLKVR